MKRTTKYEGVTGVQLKTNLVAYLEKEMTTAATHSKNSVEGSVSRAYADGQWNALNKILSHLQYVDVKEA